MSPSENVVTLLGGTNIYCVHECPKRCFGGRTELNDLDQTANLDLRVGQDFSVKPTFKLNNFLVKGPRKLWPCGFAKTITAVATQGEELIN